MNEIVDSSSKTLPLPRRYQDDRRLVAMATAAATDPELTIETDMPTLESIIATNVLRGLKKKERKRQDVINGKSSGYTHFMPASTGLCRKAATLPTVN